MPSPYTFDTGRNNPDGVARIRLAESGEALFDAAWMKSATPESTALRQHLKRRHIQHERPFSCGGSPGHKPSIPAAPADASGHDLLALMETKVSAQLLLSKEDTWGVVRQKKASAADLLGITPLLIEMLETGSGVGRSAPGRHQLGAIIRQGIAAGIPLRLLQLVVSEMAETLHHIALYDGIQACGPPPCDFMFMVMGSEGRFEQTLKTDQDNAIVFDGDEQQHQAYFLKLGEHVNQALDTYGFDLCKGDVMARNPKWCRSLTTWKRYFSNWIRTPKPMAVMQSTIFFDFKCGYGNPAFRQALRQHLRDVLSRRADLFFYHLAQNAMDNTIPLGFWGGFKYPSDEGLDLKKAMLPAVNFARLHALRHHLRHPNTLRRLHELGRIKALPADNIREIREAYILMMDLRLNHQLERLDQHQPPDNSIIPEHLPKETQDALKKALKKMKQLQQQLRLEYSSGY